MTDKVIKFIPMAFDKARGTSNQNTSPALLKALSAVGPVPNKRAPHENVQLHVLPPETILYTLAGNLAAAMTQINQVAVTLGFLGATQQARNVLRLNEKGKKMCAEIKDLAASITSPPTRPAA